MKISRRSSSSPAHSLSCASNENDRSSSKSIKHSQNNWKTVISNPVVTESCIASFKKTAASSDRFSAKRVTPLAKTMAAARVGTSARLTPSNLVSNDIKASRCSRSSPSRFKSDRHSTNHVKTRYCGSDPKNLSLSTKYGSALSECPTLKWMNPIMSRRIAMQSVSSACLALSNSVSNNIKVAFQVSEVRKFSLFLQVQQT